VERKCRLREGEDNNEVGNKVVAHVRSSFFLHLCDCDCGRDDGCGRGRGGGGRDRDRDHGRGHDDDLVVDEDSSGVEHKSEVFPLVHGGDNEEVHI